MHRAAPLKAIKLLVTLFLLLSAGAPSVTAQTPTPDPESEEIKRLKEEKTRAELKKDIVVAEKAEFDAKFPKPTTSPLAGETKINDGAVIESEMISYLSMAYAADRIVEKLRDKEVPVKNLAIYNRADIDLLLNYRATTAQLDILFQEFCNVIPDPKPEGCPGPGVKATNRSVTAVTGIISSFLGSFVDMTALLRTNVTIQGHTFSVDEASLVSEVFRAARAEDGLCLVKDAARKCLTKPSLYYPAAFPPNDPTLDTKSKLLTRLEELNNLKARVLVTMAAREELLKAIVETKGEVARLKALIKGGPQQVLNARAALAHLEEIKDEEEKHGRRMPFEMLERMKQLRASMIKLEADIKAAPELLKKAEADLATLQGAGNEDKLREQQAKMKLVNERFDQLIATLIKTDAATGINSLTAYLRAENLQGVMKEDEEGQGRSYWLQLAVVKAGGNNRIKTNLIVDIFTGGSRLSHSGGVIVQYNLYDLRGRSILSDTLTEYTGYTKAGRIKRLKNPDRVDDRPKRDERHP